MITRGAKEYPKTVSSGIQGGRPLHFLRLLSRIPLLEYGTTCVMPLALRWRRQIAALPLLFSLPALPSWGTTASPEGAHAGGGSLMALSRKLTTTLRVPFSGFWRGSVSRIRRTLSARRGPPCICGYRLQNRTRLSRLRPGQPRQPASASRSTTARKPSGMICMRSALCAHWNGGVSPSRRLHSTNSMCSWNRQRERLSSALASTRFCGRLWSRLSITSRRQSGQQCYSSCRPRVGGLERGQTSDLSRRRPQ